MRDLNFREARRNGSDSTREPQGAGETQEPERERPGSSRLAMEDPGSAVTAA